MRKGNKKIRRRPVAQSAAFPERRGTVQCVCQCAYVLQEGATVVAAYSNVKMVFCIGLSARDVMVIAVIRRVGTVAAAATPDTCCVHVCSRGRVPVL